jgi:hypothetical protein
VIGGARLEPTITVPFGIRLTPGLRWDMSYYPTPYEWFVLDPDLPDTAGHFAFNRADGNYYHVVSGPRIIWLADSVAQQFEGPLDNHMVGKRRIDNTLGGKVSLARGFGGFGTVTFTATGAKTWSTLSNRVQVDIPDWNWSALLSWRRAIRPPR